MITLKTKPVAINAKYGVFKGRMILQKKYRDTKEALAWEIKAGWPHKPLGEELSLNIVIYLGTKRKIDIDAYIKIILDAGEGILYENDNQITELTIIKQIDVENPRIELSVV